ncbi:MAG: hypothetical protein A2145_02935 [candidate division Zixibacteria bacterium RBG_16_40_9]|nr:MAG: hypothetical protein A2145_02935 [candidate division Zixibacteria bacterium RBG_16_40_9]
MAIEEPERLKSDYGREPSSFQFFLLYIGIFPIPSYFIDNFAKNPKTQLFALLLFLAQQLMALFICISLLIPKSDLGMWLKSVKGGLFPVPITWVISTIAFLIIGLEIIRF